jgi:hypothetical protein
MEKYTHNRIYVNCDCGCSSLEIGQFKEKEGYSEVFISHKTDSFYSHQRPGLNRFKEMVKMIWYILRGKEYYFYEVILSSREQIIAFKKSVAELKEDVVCESYQ